MAGAWLHDWHLPRHQGWTYRATVRWTETWSVSPSVDMLPFGVTIPATVPQRSEIPEGLTNYPVFRVPPYLLCKMGFEFFSAHIYKTVRRGTSAPNKDHWYDNVLLGQRCHTLQKSDNNCNCTWSDDILTISGVKPKKLGARTELDDPRSKPACKIPGYGA